MLPGWQQLSLCRMVGGSDPTAGLQQHADRWGAHDEYSTSAVIAMAISFSMREVIRTVAVGKRLEASCLPVGTGLPTRYAAVARSEQPACPVYRHESDVP